MLLSMIIPKETSLFRYSWKTKAIIPLFHCKNFPLFLFHYSSSAPNYTFQRSKQCPFYKFHELQNCPNVKFTVYGKYALFCASEKSYIFWMLQAFSAHKWNFSIISLRINWVACGEPIYSEQYTFFLNFDEDTCTTCPGQIRIWKKKFALYILTLVSQRQPSAFWREKFGEHSGNSVKLLKNMRANS